MARLTVTPDEPALVEAAAARITIALVEAIRTAGAATICLTGGSTPRPVYEALGDPARPWGRQIDWGRVHLFWGDERHVPPDSHDSNFKMAYDALVSRVPVPDAQVHRMRGEIADAVEAARIYELEVRASFAALGRDGVRFDLMLLGLGDDAHIASLFPGSPLLTEIADPEGSALRDAPPYVGRTLQGPPDQPLAAGVWADHLHAWRITLTPAHLLDANVILMMVDGAHKADAVYAALEEPLDVVRRPAQLLRQADDRVEWLMDAPAAARLPHAPRA